ncbi:MAG: hypothetical protein LBM16_02970 [Clostridiales bacterium]|jgi:hypothetical protein|nr:hypothetical protein [Clostridiales bacterium]
MKPNFYASVCHYGVHGGAVKLTDDYFMFGTQKIIIKAEFRRLKIAYNSIKNIEYWYALFFPIVKISLLDGRKYNFIIFNIKRFQRLIEEKMALNNKREL